MRISAGSVVVVAALAASTIAASLVSRVSADNAPQRHVVEIQKLKFVPAELEVSPGDTVVWINLDIVPHTVTATDKSWDSKTMKKKDEWEMVVGVDTPGAYFCQFHPKMKAILKVVQ